MPEGDTVFQTARRLDQALAGQVVTRFELRVRRRRPSTCADPKSTPSSPAASICCTGIGQATLHSHLRMEGQWQIHRPGERWRMPAFQARAVVATDRVETVGFLLADIEVVPTRDEERLVGHLGPDPLSERWDAAEAAARFAADPRAIHVALQEQRNVAGFGNEYASEILFLSGVDPETPATETDTAALVALGARVIQANRDRPGRTFTGDTRPGRTTWVYGRAGRPCRRCGTQIRSGTLGAEPTRERLVYWCPSCQR